MFCNLLDSLIHFYERVNNYIKSQTVKIYATEMRE